MKGIKRVSKKLLLKYNLEKHYLVHKGSLTLTIQEIWWKVGRGSLNSVTTCIGDLRFLHCYKIVNGLL